jgi:hypothetical protein
MAILKQSNLIKIFTFFILFIMFTACKVNGEGKTVVPSERLITLNNFTFLKGKEWREVDSIRNEDYNVYLFKNTDEKTGEIFQLEIKTYKTVDDRYRMESFDNFLNRLNKECNQKFPKGKYIGPFNYNLDSYLEPYKDYRIAMNVLYDAINYSLENGEIEIMFGLGHRKIKDHTIDILLYCSDKEQFDKMEGILKVSCIDRIQYIGDN